MNQNPNNSIMVAGGANIDILAHQHVSGEPDLPGR